MNTGRIQGSPIRTQLTAEAELAFHYISFFIGRARREQPPSTDAKTPDNLGGFPPSLPRPPTPPPQIQPFSSLRPPAPLPPGLQAADERPGAAQAQPRFAPLPTAQPESDDGAEEGHQFRLVSYNILAQVYVKSTFFPHSPSASLKWKARSKAVLTELKNFQADLMCIQELDEYETFYRKNMESSGYSSIYVQRSGDKRDGCGIFYKPKRDPEWTDVKLAQVKYLLSKVSEFENIISNKFTCKPSVIIAGDFNSTPGDKVYNYLVSANPESTDEAPITLRSLYAANGGEPEYTNYTPGFTGTLDYVFLSDGSSIKPISLLRLPRGDSADVQGGLPNFHHPSDHLPIGADFHVLSS